MVFSKARRRLVHTGGLDVFCVLEGQNEKKSKKSSERKRAEKWDWQMNKSQEKKKVEESKKTRQLITSLLHVTHGLSPVI